jgi:hypothetical protein
MLVGGVMGNQNCRWALRHRGLPWKFPGTHDRLVGDRGVRLIWALATLLKVTGQFEQTPPSGNELQTRSKRARLRDFSRP